MIRRSIALAMALALAGAASAGTVVPTSFEAGHFYYTPTLANGQTLRLLVDSGGGGPTWWIYPSVAAPLALKPKACGTGVKVYEPPAFAPGKGVLTSTQRCGGVWILEGEKEEPGRTWDGLVGNQYLSTNAWTFDYPGHTLTREDSHWKPAKGSHVITPGYPRDQNGHYKIAFGRIPITVDGESIDLLLDTGATARPTPAGKAIMHTETAADGLAGGSYITTPIMDAWHAKHPDWPLVDKADDIKPGMRAIRVPDVVIAGWHVGPVWFIERPDKNFVEYMSSMMDGTVHGAVGGNVFAPFRMTIDYPHGKVWFACMKGCKSAG